jgi:hypothetical protein
VARNRRLETRRDIAVCSWSEGEGSRVPALALVMTTLREAAAPVSRKQQLAVIQAPQAMPVGEAQAIRRIAPPLLQRRKSQARETPRLTRRVRIRGRCVGTFQGAESACWSPKS